jgi:hypothetical protein
MNQGQTFLEYLLAEEPVFLKTLAVARQQGLLVVDDEIDAVGASTRLLLTSTVLQDVLNEMVADWMDHEENSKVNFEGLVRTLKEKQDAET